MKTIVDLMDENIKQLDDIRSELHDNKDGNMAINIIIDDSDAQNQIFIEIENDDGTSIRIGEFSTDDDGYRKIRISASDIIEHYNIYPTIW